MYLALSWSRETARDLGQMMVAGRPAFARSAGDRLCLDDHLFRVAITRHFEVLNSCFRGEFGSSADLPIQLFRILPTI
jgi:hypothetical protein